MFGEVHENRGRTAEERSWILTSVAGIVVNLDRCQWQKLIDHSFVLCFLYVVIITGAGPAVSGVNTHPRHQLA
jgi:hypothetical protein